MARSHPSKSRTSGLQLPLFGPASDWTPDLSFPTPQPNDFVAIDTETKDPGLRDLGPGFLRGTAKVAGYSIAFGEFATYLPIGHNDGCDLDRSQINGYIQSIVKRLDIKLTGANILYDIEAMDSEGVKVSAPLYDTQVLEPLLDEEKPGGVGLENLGWDYLGRGKDVRLLEEALIAHGLYERKKGKTIPDRGMMAHLPSKFVGPYAVEDVRMPNEIVPLQLMKLAEEELGNIFKLEQELEPIMWEMRKLGVRVDVEAAEAMIPDLAKDENDLLEKLRHDTGLKIDPFSGKSLEILFKQLGYDVRYTIKGNPTFTADYLEEMAGLSPIIEDVLTFRKLFKMRRDFIQGMIIEKPVNGRLHPNWHQLRAPAEGADEDEANGVRGGRIASTKVNLTQIPSRHPKWGPLIRRLFIADEGGRWCKCDYEQQEPRLQLEYAVRKGLPGAAEALQRYIDDPDTDYHQMVADLCTQHAGYEVKRRPAKTINLGLAYGMGEAKLAHSLGMELDEAKKLFAVYHAAVPYVRLLSQKANDQAASLGYVRTILGRRRHYRDWEPIASRFKDRVLPRRNYQEAVDSWKYVKRAYTHKAFNAIVQGSAADQTKTAIIQLHREGLTPQIQVYDELNRTIYSDAEAWRMKEIMEQALPNMTVPFLTKPEVGPSWGAVEKLQ